MITMNTQDSYPLYLFHEGTNYEAYKLMSPVKISKDGVDLWRFRVWAPAASEVSVIGSFNDWTPGVNKMEVDDNGVWTAYIAGPKRYDGYKFAVTTKSGETVNKIDPYALHFETAPGNASKLYDISGYKWGDKKWLRERETFIPYERPVNVYELHAGSWRKYQDGNYYNYEKLADELIPYVKKMNYTHVELMPITEYPFDGSWGYQTTGLFAPTSRFGTPEDFMAFVDKCHRAGIGVLLDLVLSHFPKDRHGLADFDGTALYEYADPRKGEHKEWGTKIYDFGKNEVKSFLISAAMFWFDAYHIDGIRLDAVASMLYLDYGRKDGDWVRNEYGGNYNLEARDFLRAMNTAILSKYRGAMTIAEESTAYPMVTMPAYDGGLGFNLKWNMGWMNDSLKYLSCDPLFRKNMHGNLTFSITYAFSENYVLPLSHDEVVHGKASMIGKCPGEYEAKFEGLKAFYGYMTAHPGKKLTFMGSEFAQFIEWNYTQELDWFLLDFPRHRTLQKFVKDLNEFYLKTPAMYEQDTAAAGFKWLVVDDNMQNIISFIRYAKDGSYIVAVLNFSGTERVKYRMGVPENCSYKTELLSSMQKYGGTSTRRMTFKTSEKPMHGQPYSTKLIIPANSVMFLKPVDDDGDENGDGDSDDD
ncbi:MAG: 1,4-alpha-glucan branching protein GlgB [Clostridiaceae bacterium]|jgi:1,4-alpha-glucan branching enzyme|nr:1,4-alpha-glucan branching protein GlgB [Clostridiaceae bacterium]